MLPIQFITAFMGMCFSFLDISVWGQHWFFWTSEMLTAAGGGREGEFWKIDSIAAMCTNPRDLQFTCITGTKDYRVVLLSQLCRAPVSQHYEMLCLYEALLSSLRLCVYFAGFQLRLVFCCTGDGGIGSCCPQAPRQGDVLSLAQVWWDGSSLCTQSLAPHSRGPWQLLIFCSHRFVIAKQGSSQDYLISSIWTPYRRGKEHALHT